MGSSTSSGRSDHLMHPTATRLLESAVELLEGISPEMLGLAAVLEHSGVSHGSLYHHFEDFHDLVEQAVVHRFIRRLTEGTVAIATTLEARDEDDFRARVEALFIDFISVNRHRNRMDQIEALAASAGRSRLAERIARAERDLTDERAAIIAEAQSRGWIRKDLDPGALSVFLQGTAIGRAVDDIAGHHVEPAAWEKIALITLRAVFFGE